MSTDHFIDAKTAKMIRARILELYATHGDKAFRLPGVQKAIDLLLDPDMQRNRAALKAWNDEVRAAGGFEQWLAAHPEVRERANIP
jgi:hypothetical protein